MKISRRNFFKCAGLMALTVAAAGVLAGCASFKDVKVTFTPSNEALASYKSTATVRVDSSATQISADYLKSSLPAKFTFADSSTTAYTITQDETGAHLTVNTAVDTANYKTVNVQYYEKGVGEAGTQVVIVAKTATALTAADLTLPTGYSVASDVDYAITSLNTAIINVTK